MAVFSWLVANLLPAPDFEDFSDDLQELEPQLERIIHRLKTGSKHTAPPPQGFSTILNLVGRLQEELQEIERAPLSHDQTYVKPVPTPRKRVKRTSKPVEPASHKIARRLLASGLSLEKVSQKTLLPESALKNLLPKDSVVGAIESEFLRADSASTAFVDQALEIERMQALL